VSDEPRVRGIAESDIMAVEINRLQSQLTAAQERNRELTAEVERLHLGRIAYENPGIDIEEVKRFRATGHRDAPKIDQDLGVPHE
jgi:hypothetical protein